MKKLLLSLVALLATLGAWAQIEVSTKVDAPEVTYSLCSKNGFYMSTGTGSTQYNIGRFAFYKADGENSYKIFSVDANKWISYTKAGSYSNGNTGKTALIDSMDDALAWKVVKNATNAGYFNISPYKTDGTPDAFYWNFYGGAGPGNPYGYDDNKTVGFYDEVNDGGSLWNLEKLVLATEDQVNNAKAIVKTGPGYPKTTSSVYQAMNALTFGKSTTKHIDLAMPIYKTITDIQLPEDGKAYTFTALFKDGKKYNMNYQNGSQISVSDAVTASTFVCKELRAGVYAFITEDGKILTWVGNDEGNAYKETDFSKPYGYSNYYATTYNNKSDWNEITVKKNDSNAEQLGLLRLVARRHSTGTSSFIANTNKRFDQASDGNWFNSDNTSGWIVTEVEHTNTDAQNVAIAKIAVKEAGYAFGTNVGEYYYMSNDVKVSDKETAFATLDKQATVNDVTTFKNSFILNMPEAGKFYRIKNSANNPAYLISGTHANRVNFATDAATKSNSIFYYADAKLLSYENGMYLVKRQSENFMGYAQSVGSSIDIRFAECGTIGKYNIIFNTNRYFYSNGTGSNAGSSDGDQYYRFTLEEVTSLPVTVTAAKYATFYAPVAVQAEGVTANTVTVDGNIATLNEIEGGVIPANTGVILNGEAGTYNFAITTTANTIESGLKGTVEAAYVTEDAYVLANGDNGVGLYKAAKQNNQWLNNGFKAYLPADAVPAGARFLSFDFGTETAIESVESETAADAVVYDLAGRRVKAAQKGLYIVNGKVVIK